MRSAEDRGGPSAGSLLVDLARLTGDLLRQEVALMRAEMNEKLARVTEGGLLLGVGLAFALLGVLGLGAAAVLALALVLPAWLAALIVGLAALVLGALLAYAGRASVRRVGLAPDRTIRSLRDGADWARDQVR